MAVMQEGKILQTGSPLSIYTRPQNIKVAGFIGINNILPGSVKEGVFTAGELKIPLSPAHQSLKAGYLLLKPETLKAVKENIPFSFPGTIEEITFQPGFYHIKVKAGGFLLHIVQKYESSISLTVGEKVFVNYNPEEVLLL